VEKKQTAAVERRSAPDGTGSWGLPIAEGTPLYIHVPFCEAKCPYCDFFSIAGEGQDVRGSLDALLVELERRAPVSPRTIFIGGGTPSWLTISQLTELFEALQKKTGFRDKTQEVTVECNPESLSPEKAKALVELGATRLSIGFQSLRPETLKFFGRVHGVEESIAAYEAARAANPRGVSIDLIFGAPGQTPREWGEDLDQILALRPDHISCYALTFEEGTQFTRWLKSGRIQQMPTEEELALFQLTRDRLLTGGYEAYEVSNFSLKGQQCGHNINYWLNGPYVGIGPGAVSHVDGMRFGNPRALEGWRRAAVGGEDPTSWSEKLEPKHRLAETWWLGMRLSAGVDPVAARTLAGVDPEDDPCLPIAKRLAIEGLLFEKESRWCLTPRGLELADAISKEMLAAGQE
jgi:oxygen-independent coproporphyrinogen-3 oxidase